MKNFPKQKNAENFAQKPTENKSDEVLAQKTKEKIPDEIFVEKMKKNFSEKQTENKSDENFVEKPRKKIPENNFVALEKNFDEKITEIPDAPSNFLQFFTTYRNLRRSPKNFGAYLKVF